MFKIVSVKWISEEALEAEVTVTDGTFEITCFSQPFKYLEGDRINENLYAFNVKSVRLSHEPIERINRIGNNFEYQIIGQLINKLNSVISIGEMLIEIEAVPNDVKEGEYIEFNCTRIDMY